MEIVKAHFSPVIFAQLCKAWGYRVLQQIWKALFGNIRYLINECRAYHVFLQLASIILAAANYAVLIFRERVTDLSVPSG